MSVKNINHPPMGWNSWDCYGTAVNEEQLLGNAEYMRDNLKAFGWEYVVCDIQWSEPNADSTEYNHFAELCMDEYSRLIPAQNRFPSSAGGKGFKPIADKIHAMGLKFGIHIMRGVPRQAVHRNTPIMCEGVTARNIAQSYSVCPWNTDMYGVDHRKNGAQEYYDSIFKLYAQWEVDYIKCDDIANTEFKPHEPYSAKEEIEMIRKAIDKCGRKMVLSLSPGPAPVSEYKHLRENAELWRMSGDFWDKWDRIIEMLQLCRKWAPYVTDGAYPDCDMLPVGRLCITKANPAGRWTNFNENEQITMLSLWSIFRSPLMIGAEMRDNDEFTLKLLTNKEILDMNKKSRNAREVYLDENQSVWLADSTDGGRYCAIFNLSEENKEFIINAQTICIDDNSAVTELWSGEKIKVKDAEIKLEILTHSAKVLKY